MRRARPDRTVTILLVETPIDDLAGVHDYMTLERGPITDPALGPIIEQVVQRWRQHLEDRRHVM